MKPKRTQSAKVISTQENLAAVLSLLELCLPSSVAEGGLFFIFLDMEFSSNRYLSEYCPYFSFILRHYHVCKVSHKTMCHYVNLDTPSNTQR
jgi:hypothetical protein